ncbi:hypothetical protein [Streptomyces sp. NPDC060027]|uniref:hypothetical protein n=1 Tax=Streptomyces sp. NPDC060027 TaxID=3347040 RepID=UPI00369D7AEA
MQDAAGRAGRPLRVAPWVAPSRHDDQAELAFAQGREDRFELFAAAASDGLAADHDQPGFFGAHPHGPHV